MKIKTFTRTHDEVPSQCKHEWRLFGTRLEEEVWTPIRKEGVPKPKCGWVICDKCGWQPYAEEYKVIGTRPYKPFADLKDDWDFWKDTMIEVVKWGTAKEPTEPVVDQFSYAEFSLWDKLKSWMKWTLNY